MNKCLVMIMIISILVPWNMKEIVWNNLTDDQKENLSDSSKAWFADMSEEDFSLMSAIVEAESDRGENIDGRKLIALTIFNREDSDRWPNDISKVITQSGQFQVYYEGTYRSVGRTDLSDQAVIEANFWRKHDHPNVIYFNSIGYNYLGTPYDYVDGNYFETSEE